jgi:hypothetical protein
MAEVVLKKSRAMRGGRTAKEWTSEIKHITCFPVGSEVAFDLEMPSKGGGHVQVQIRIDPEDFGAVLANMAEADRHLAMVAMSEKLAELIAQQPGQDAITAKQAQDAIVKAAEQKALHATSDTEDLDELVAKRVKLLSR